MSKISIIRGDSEDITVTFTDSDDAVIDITGATVFFTVKERADVDDTDDTNAVISKDITSHTDPTAGETTIELTSTDTDIDSDKDYVFDIQIKYATGDISSTEKGDFDIIEDVTKRTS